MSIDEAIAHARDISAIQRNNDKLNKTLGANSPYYKTDCLKCAEEHEQLAEWLEELKEYKEHEFDILKKDGQLLYKQGILDGYNKAIDDFANACKSNILCQTFGLRQFDIEEMAEKLKAGGRE